MSNTEGQKPGEKQGPRDRRLASPIEVWLTQKNLEITCMEVREDETTETIDVDSLSMRGAQREMTGWYLKRGYVPVGRWEAAGPAGNSETFRRFKLAGRLDVSPLDKDMVLG